MFPGETLPFVETQENKCSAISGNSNQAHLCERILKVIAILKLFSKERSLFVISKSLQKSAKWKVTEGICC